jgi:hypothetical protein
MVNSRRRFCQFEDPDLILGAGTIAYLRDGHSLCIKVYKGVDGTKPVGINYTYPDFTLANTFMQEC